MRGTPSRFTDGSDGPRRRDRPDRPDRPGGGGFAIDTRLLIVVFVAIAIVVIVVSSMLPDTNEPDPVAIPTDTAEPTQPPEDPTTEPTTSTDDPAPTDTAPPEEGSDHDDGGNEPAPAEAATAATKFVDAWLLRGDETERRDAMAPYATPGLVRSVATADINGLPDAERTGKPQEISSGTYQAAFRISLTNDDKVDVVVVFGDDDKWRASEINPVDVG